MRYSVQIAPVTNAIEAVTVVDAKNFLRIDSGLTSDDALVGSLITAARSVAEKYLNKIIIQSTVVMTMDCLPGDGFRLPYGPVQSVTSIQITDSTNATTTWDPSNYLVDLTGMRIVYASSAVFPTSFQIINSVKVTYVAGYSLLSDVTGVPGGIAQAIRHLVASSYENREGMPLIATSLLDPFRKIVL